MSEQFVGENRNNKIGEIRVIDISCLFQIDFMEGNLPFFYFYILLGFDRNLLVCIKDKKMVDFLP